MLNRRPTVRIAHVPHNYNPAFKALPLTNPGRHGERGAAGGNEYLRMICLWPADPVGATSERTFDTR